MLVNIYYYSRENPLSLRTALLPELDKRGVKAIGARAGVDEAGWCPVGSPA